MLRVPSRGDDVLRENQFLVGGGLTVAVGVALAAGLVWAGAGWAGFGGWLAVGLAGFLGALFLYVGRAEGRERRRALTESERSLPP